MFYCMFYHSTEVRTYTIKHAIKFRGAEFSIMMSGKTRYKVANQPVKLILR